jgi:hypothetical protein
MMRLYPIPLVLAGSLLAMLPSVAHGQNGERPPAWCNAGHTADSTSLVGQAIQALTDSTAGGDGTVLKVDDFQVVKTSSLEQGVIVSLVNARPHVRGGGGLVWVDIETSCAIVLRRYE